MTRKEYFVLAILLVAIGVTGRLLPHPWNATPISAVALFAASVLGYRASVVVTIAAMLASDMVLGFHSPAIMVAVYGSFGFIGLLGLWIRRAKSIETIAAASILGSTLFFLTTNWAVWQFGSMYPHTLSGLLESYTMGLPFFRNMMLGDLGYTLAIFGLYEYAMVFRIRIPCDSNVH